MADQWKAEPFDGADKTITLIGPSDGFYPQEIYLDFDDVNHPEIERRVPLILAALNSLGLEPPAEDS